MKENAEKCYKRLAINNDYDAFWDKVNVYTDENIFDNKGYLWRLNVDPESRTLNKKALKND